MIIIYTVVFKSLHTLAKWCTLLMFEVKRISEANYFRSFVAVKCGSGDRITTMPVHTWTSLERPCVSWSFSYLLIITYLVSVCRIICNQQEAAMHSLCWEPRQLTPDIRMRLNICDRLLSGLTFLLNMQISRYISFIRKTWMLLFFIRLQVTLMLSLPVIKKTRTRRRTQCDTVCSLALLSHFNITLLMHKYEYELLLMQRTSVEYVTLQMWLWISIYIQTNK